MQPATAMTGRTDGRRFSPDVRLVRTPDGKRAGLQRGIRVVWLPADVAGAVWKRGPYILGADFCRILADAGMLADGGLVPVTETDRNEVFVDAICGPRTDMQGFRDTGFVMTGCGGLGSQIAIQLAALGARRFTLIDGDVIEASNLNRLIFADKADCGRLKVDVLAAHLERRFGCRVRRLPLFVSDADACIGAVHATRKPFVILSADEAPAMRAFLAALYRLAPLPPYVHAGYVGPYCVAGPLALAPGDACPFCGSSAEVADRTDFVAPSALANNALIAGFVVTQILLTRTTGATPLRGRRWRFDLRTAQSSLFDISTQHECEVCQSHAKHFSP